MRQAERSEATRGRILQAAENTFARGGYDGTGVAAICDRAGVTKGAFYHHFPSKQAVFLELLDRWLGGLEAQLRAVRASAGTVPENLLEMTDTLPAIFQAAEGRLPLFLEFLMQSMRDPKVARATAEPYRRYRRFFAEMIAAGINEGSLRPTEADLAAHVVVAFAVGVLMQGLFDRQGAAGARVAREGMQILLQGLERKK